MEEGRGGCNSKNFSFVVTSDSNRSDQYLSKNLSLQKKGQWFL